MSSYLWFSQEDVDSLQDALFVQRHSIQPVFNEKALHFWLNVGLADEKPVAYSAATPDSTPPRLHDDWGLVTKAEKLECLVSTSEGLTDAGRTYARDHGWKETPWDLAQGLCASEKTAGQTRQFRI